MQITDNISSLIVSNFYPNIFENVLTDRGLINWVPESPLFSLGNKVRIKEKNFENGFAADYNILSPDLTGSVTQGNL